MSLTVTDLFAGFGGASSGAVLVPDIHVQIAANHWPLAVEVHNLNHPTTDHAQVDLHLEDPAFFPRTDLLWASPECTAWSQAGGGKHGPLSGKLAEPDLFTMLDEDDLLTSDEDEATRSRLLMFDVLRFIDHYRYAAVIVENVVDIATQAKYSRAWAAWQLGLRNLGYSYRVVSLNSMHAQALGMPAPLRMLEPREIGNGMAFSPDYQVRGSRRDQVRGYGNAVTPPAARDLVACVAESLGAAA